MIRSTPYRIAITGFGSVGQGLASILVDDPGLPIVISAVADRGGYALSAAGLDPRSLLNAKQTGSVANHSAGRSGTLDAARLRESGANVLVEVASTNFSDGQPGWGYVQDALENGLHVVLASKGPLVTHWDELYAMAEAHNRKVAISATHGAPMPVIDFARYGLAGSHIKSIRALFNSTTGLLLEQMELGKSLAESIEVARGYGVVETDPSLDIEGWDAAAKCVIVSRSLFGGSLSIHDVDRTGIEAVTTSQVQAAATAGTPMKLLCTIEPGDDGPRTTVCPTMLPTGDPLATLRNGALGIVYDTVPMGPVFLAAYGGANGGITTAAAVIRDILSMG